MSSQHRPPPWRQFAVCVRRARRLSPSFLRVAFTGADLDTFADNGFDQRIKLVFPLPGAGMAPLPTGPDWYARWRALPPERQNPIRTYTVRAVRPSARELDVDLVRHGEAGPASRWAGAARPGDPLTVIGPDATHPGPHGGREFRPPAGAGTILLAGDETAVPAISAILERLPRAVRGEALLEVPGDGDVLEGEIAAPAAVRVRWLPRAEAPHGSRLVPAVRAAAARLRGAVTPAGAVLPGDAASTSPCSTDVDRDILWEVPPDTAPAAGWYAWLAGEVGVIRTLRRHLISEQGVDRRSVAFMGYWRLGRPEPGG